MNRLKDTADPLSVFAAGGPGWCQRAVFILSGPGEGDFVVAIVDDTLIPTDRMPCGVAARYDKTQTATSPASTCAPR